MYGRADTVRICTDMYGIGFSNKVITQLDWPQIARGRAARYASCELGLRRQVAHFRVSKRIRLILGNKNCSRGPEC